MAIQSVGVVGAGQMGNGIAHVFALAGYDVLMTDISRDALDQAVALIDRNIERQVSRGKTTAEEKAAAMARISTTMQLADLGKTDLMYYMTKNVFMDTNAKAEFSNNGQFTVLTLVDGENVRVYSKSNPDFYYDQKFLDIVVVPASITDYVIENTGYQPCVVHKTMLKEGYEAQFGIEGEEE